MFLDEALMYLDMGWAVYPSHSVAEGRCSCGRPECTSPGKHPVGQWSEFSTRLPGRQEVIGWFGSMPDCNIGTVTGMVSGIAVVDVDGNEGLRSIKALGLAPTLSSRTGGNGYHHFYSISKAVPNRVKLCKGVDIRGDGGYVVLPPSYHVSGRYYRWLPGRLEPFDYDLLNRAAPLPNGLTYNNGNGWVSELLRGVGKGERNSSAARLVGRYLNLGLSQEETWMLLQCWNSRNDPPMDDDEVRDVLSYVSRRFKETSLPHRIETKEQILALLGGRPDVNHN